MKGVYETGNVIVTMPHSQARNLYRALGLLSECYAEGDYEDTEEVCGGVDGLYNILAIVLASAPPPPSHALSDKD